MATDTAARKKKGIFYGWYMVGAGLILNMWSGSIWTYGFTAFFNPIRSEFKWSSAQTALAFSFQRLETGLAAPIIGFALDRIGSRKMMLIGVPIAALGFFFLSQVTSLWMFYAAFVVIASGTSMCSLGVVTVAVNNWFRRRRGRALSILAVGMGLSGSGVPLVAMLIAGVGWRMALVVAAVGWLVVGPSIALVMRHRPERYGYLPDGDLPKEPVAVSKGAERIPVIEEYNFTWREAIRTRSFYLMALIGSTQAVLMSPVFVLEMPYLESVGYSTSTAALILTAMTLSSLLGRLGLGSLTDFIEPRFVYMMLFALEVVGLVAYSFIGPGSPFLLVLFLVTFPIGYGASTPTRPSMLGSYFGRHSFGSIQGLQSLITMWAGIAAPPFAGWVYDTTGSYQTAWLVFAGLALVSIPLAFLTTRPKLPAHARRKQAEQIAQVAVESSPGHGRA
ncbi:MAG: MFS transporter [Chloroflexi bacterium]|nr:MFS transporter [Chloroflexota bacterium]MBI4216740.1 MFS transporter [Chloroflexota bacterium]